LVANFNTPKEGENMKKFFILFAAILLVASMSFAQSTANETFNLSMTVDKYLETAPGPISFDFGTTMHFTAPSREELFAAFYGPWGEWDLAYANCPLTITVSGDNPAGQGKPRFARHEVGAHANGFDVLSTAWQIGFLTNGVWNNELGLNYGVRAGAFPKTATLDEAPHNGQVHMKMSVKVNSTSDPNEISTGFPIRETVINPAFTWDQSADAGVYTCTMLVTLTAI